MSDDSYIAQIDFWYNDRGGISALRFSAQNGEQSDVYGSVTSSDNSDAEVMRGENDAYVFAGYTVYVNGSAVMGMDALMLNDDVG